MKIDLSRTSGEVFYKYIYPLFAEQFLFGSNYLHFAEMVEERFILNETQWEYILSEWEIKESVLVAEQG